MPGVAPSGSDPIKRGHVTPVTYDQFGNFLLPGGEIYSMAWNQSRIGASSTFDGSWANIFNNIMISADEFSNWQTRFIISTTGGNGRGIRTYFTPSTLKRTNFQGFRWDASSRKNNVTLVASAGATPLYGLHWQSVLGDILKVGATYVNQQRGTIEYSHQDIDRSILSEPRYVYVVITDDSPEDTGPGALVYGIKAIVNGKEEPIAFHGEEYPVKGRVFRIPDIITKKRYHSGDFQKQHIFDYHSAYMFYNESQLRNSKSSWFLGLLNTRRLDDMFHKSGQSGSIGYLSLTTDVVGGDPYGLWDDRVDDEPASNRDHTRYFKADMSHGVLEARNTDVIIYEFLVPHGTRDLAFNVNVANDYCIDIIAPLYSFRQTGEGNWFDEPLTDAWAGHWSIQTYDKKHVRKAPGNVKDGSNQKWVKIRYDRITGMNVYGMNMELDWRGLFVRAEMNEYNTKWSYPLAEQLSGGKRTDYTTRAWFVNVEKEFDKWSFGGELWNYPNEYMQYMPTIDDNDDDDWYVGGGEYPSRDMDFDRYIDTTWSGRPYLGYFYDSVTMGDDFNHAGGIDARENDSAIDLPYDTDSRGQHYFLKIRPKESTILTLGHYDIRQEYMEGRNFTRYLKFEHYQPVKDMGEITFYHTLERIKDNSKLWGYHSTNSWSLANTIASRFTLIPNLNIINNGRFSAGYRVGDNRRLDGTEEEIIRNLIQISNDGERITRRYGSYSYALEHKADYTFRVADARILPELTIGSFRLWREKRIKEFKLMPMIKFVHSHGYSLQNDWSIREEDRKSYSYNFYPILRFDYRVAPKTLLRFGIQGFPGFPQKYRRNYNRLYNYDMRNMVFAFENRTLYQGFNLLVMMGMRFSKTKYINDLSKKDPGATEYFITLQSEASK